MKSFLNKYIKNFGCDWTNKSDVLNKVKQDGLNLIYADYGLRDDIDVVLTAIKNNPLSLEFASRELRNDRKIALATIQNGSNQFISEELKNNLEFAKEVWESTKKLTPKSNGHPENILPPLYSNSSVWLELAKHPYALINYKEFVNMSDELKSNKDFMMNLIKEQPLCYMHASNALKDDDELAELAIKSWGTNLAEASQRIKELKKFQELFLNFEYEQYHYAITGKKIPARDIPEEIILDIKLHSQTKLDSIIRGDNPYFDNKLTLSN